MFLMLLSEERANITFRGLIGEGLWVNYSELHCKKNKKKQNKETTLHFRKDEEEETVLRNP